MKIAKPVFILFLGLLLLLSISSLEVFAATPKIPATKAARVDLISNWWTFDTSNVTSSSIEKGARKGKFTTSNPKDGFTIKVNVDLSRFEGEVSLLEIADVVSVKMRRASNVNRERQNYPAFKMPDGSVPVLEASIMLYRDEPNSKGQKMEIGLPLAMLEKSYGKHEVVLNFSGSHWTMYVDKQLVDNDFPIGYPKWDAKAEWSINPKYVENAEIFTPAIKPQRDTSKKSEAMPQVQYWTPIGHNSWVGDVATTYHSGRFHIFYLYDRRNHSSKFATGGHYFEHLSTADFKTWTEHEPATPIEEQWETFGTGTPFALNNKFYISYGLHTSRIYPPEKNMTPMLKAYYENYGKTGAFDYNSFPSVPSGATYSESQDGVSNFVKSKKIIHFSENPSVYIGPDGKLTMLASFRSKGMWQSESLDSGWYCVDENFPPGGDCTFFFRWGKYDYVIGGFVSLWSKSAGAPNKEYKSVVEEGDDFYNGFNVPSISEISDGRFLMSAWMPMVGWWGGPLLIHEMLQMPNGRIGTKWMEELVPETESAKSITKILTEPMIHNTKANSFMLTFDVVPTKAKDGKLAVSFLPAEGTYRACEFQLRVDDLVAQYNDASFDGYSVPEKSLRQGGNPGGGRNYAIEKLMSIDKPFQVRIVVKHANKFGGTLIDSEIAAHRTMVTYRPDLLVEKLMFKADGVEVKSINIAPLK